MQLLRAQSQLSFEASTACADLPFCCLQAVAQRPAPGTTGRLCCCAPLLGVQERWWTQGADRRSGPILLVKECSAHPYSSDDFRAQHCRSEAAATWCILQVPAMSMRAKSARHLAPAALLGSGLCRSVTLLKDSWHARRRDQHRAQQGLLSTGL